MNKYTRKISALKALAADSAASPEERNTALAKATELSLRYNIESTAHSEQDSSTITVWPLAIDTTGNLGKSRASLVYHVAEALGCAAVVRQTRNRYMVLIAGAAIEITTARDMIPLIMLQAQHEASQHTAETHHAVRARRDFLTAYALEIASRITQRRHSVMSEPGQWETALTLRDNTKRAKTWLHQNIDTRITTETRRTSASTQAGRDAARRANIGDAQLTQ